MHKLVALVTLSLLSSSVLAAEHVVEMKNNGADGIMVFEPAFLSVDVGDTVRFVATDPGHNSQSVQGLVPAGTSGWNGAINEEFSVTLSDEGVYVYQCAPHVALAMVGVIVAGDPVNIDDIRANSDALKGRLMMNQDRLSKYLDKVK